MMNKVIAGVASIACLLSVAACDNTYTPSAHHQDAASTGSLLSGTDTGANPNGTMNDPSLKSNFGSGNTGH
ncbi:hypothetical protein [Lichenicoccus sp.]|uniref:hypothetical protein n=1 Tax=Lichenicoccus sp. TaxID=2781899 RepID=UPI003D0CB971